MGLAAVLVAALSALAPAQDAPRLDLGGAMLPRGEELGYLRALSTLDSARESSLLIQPFGLSADRNWRRLATEQANPWQAQFVFDDAKHLRRWRGVEYFKLRAESQLRYHSAIPTLPADGAMWAGRGTTVSVQAGRALRWRGLRVQLAPLVYMAQNADFEMAANGQTGDLAYGDARFPRNIDLPQRFGNGAYGRLDWGDSFIDYTGFGLHAGFSNARQHWGPAREYPLVLGTNSGGFAHGFVGTAKPLDLWIGQVQMRLMTGRLEQSRYSPVQGGEPARYLTGVIGSFSPAFFPGVELGAIRIATNAWPEGGLSAREIFRPFVGIISDNVSDINQNSENQFASAFLRIAPPRSGFELYGELSREDFAGSWRWLWMQPDDLMDFTVGLAQTWKGSGERLHVLRMELVNAELSHQERLLRLPKRPFPPYTHSQTRQGLTNRGQLLGSPAAYGGGGGILTYDRYFPGGRFSLSGERNIVMDWLPNSGNAGVPWPEVRYGFRAELLRLKGDTEWSLMLAPSYTLNRYIEQGRDVFDLALHLRLRAR